jgi:hypothetical protein
MEFPPSAPVKKLDCEHQEFSFFKEAYDQIDLMYQGGIAMREAVIRSGQFLIKATKELPEVYATRQMRFSYTNLLGNVIGWYTSALFKEPPQLTKAIAGSTGEKAQNIPAEAAAFCSDFENDCDRAGTSLNDFMRNASEKALLFRKAYICLDTPGPPDGSEAPLTLQEQKASGALDPFLVLYTPRDVINWATDSYGNLEWIEIKIRIQDQEFLGDSKVTDYWYYFDRENVALYERELKTGDTVGTTNVGGAEEMAQLAPGYPRRHAMAEKREVPIRLVALPEGLWLANRVFLPLVNHLNQDNALDFGLFQANLPQLVIEDGEDGAQYEEPVTISAVGYHHMPHGGDMYFLEPEGKSFSASQQRIDNLEERIYKACYLTDQARTNRSTPAAQSGISKQMDKTPSRDALSGIGAIIRVAEQRIYTAALELAGFSNITPDIRGLDFSDKVTTEDMALIEQSSVVQVNSPLFEREIAKKNVRLSLPDANSETLDAIDKEIDTNPTPMEAQAQQQEAQRQAAIDQFSSSLQSASNTLPQSQ